jgi:hypothetical protein
MRARTRPNPDRQALVADVLEQISLEGTELWRERWDHARELAVEDVQEELLEGLRDFAQQYQDALLARTPSLQFLQPEEQQALQAWVATAPSAFRVGGPLDRRDRAGAREEWSNNYAELVVQLFPDHPASQKSMMDASMVKFAYDFFRRVLGWTATTIDRGAAEAAATLWDFEPFLESLPDELIGRGSEVLEDDIRKRVLEIFPQTTAGDPIEALREISS